ncbi:MAG: hypothetical protein MUD01_08615 [Chloroflexaceae bacterium]|jgi:hypothetical protein|nr:hypothetical protein [Chloroflexaceae bacterium]
MTLEEAIQDLSERISAAAPSAVVRVTRVSAEEASMRAYAPADAAEAVKEATRERTMTLLMEHGLDIQVIVYDLATDLPPDS